MIDKNQITQNIDELKKQKEQLELAHQENLSKLDEKLNHNKFLMDCYKLKIDPKKLDEIMCITATNNAGLDVEYYPPFVESKGKLKGLTEKRNYSTPIIRSPLETYTFKVTYKK